MRLLYPLNAGCKAFALGARATGGDAGNGDEAPLNGGTCALVPAPQTKRARVGVPHPAEVAQGVQHREAQLAREEEVDLAFRGPSEHPLPVHRVQRVSAALLRPAQRSVQGAGLLLDAVG